MDKNLESEEYYNKGIEFFQDCDYNKSLVLSKRAITTKDNYYYAHFSWGRNLISKDPSSNQALRKHKELISRDPTDGDAYHNLGVAFEEQERFLEAEMQYKKSIELDPINNIEAHHNLAIILTKQAKYTKAIEQYEENIKENPGDSSTYSCHGYLKFTLGKYEEAIKSFEKAISKDPDYSLPVLNKSLALYCMGDSELAVEVFKESLENLAEDEDWQTRFQEYLRIYEGELRRFKKTLESGDVGEIPRETLLRNIKALCFIVKLLKQVLLGKTLD